MSAIERWHEPPSEREFAALERQARVFSKTGLVPKTLRGKPDDIMAIQLTARDLGMQLTLTTLSQFHVIEGKVEPSAQMAVAMAAARGHEVWFDYAGPESATICVRRAGSERVQQLTYTREEAVQAGLLDGWVERWTGGETNRKVTFVVDRDGHATDQPVPEWAKRLIEASDVKRRENWIKYPTDMLMARASKRAVRKFLPEVLLGVPAAPLFDDDLSAPDQALGGEAARGSAADPVGATRTTPQESGDDDIVDAELVDDKGAPAGAGEGDVASAPAGELPLVDDLWVQRFAMACREVGLNDHQRHALVRHATQGRVSSSKQIRSGDEQRQVSSWFVAVRDGFAAVEETPDGWELVETAKTRGES